MSSESAVVAVIPSSITGLQDIKEEEDIDSDESIRGNSSVIKFNEIEKLNEPSLVQEEDVRASPQKEAAIEDSIPEIESHLLGLMLETKENDKMSGEAQEELLLPPLPDVVAKRISIYQEESVANLSSASSLSEDSATRLSPEFEVVRGDVDRSFDLSKALEIPTNSTTESSLNRSSSNQNTPMHFSQPLTPSVAVTPKMALKRRFSNTLLSQAFSQEGIFTGSSSIQSFSQNGDFALHKTSTRSSGHTSSSSSVIKNKSRSNSNVPLNGSLDTSSIGANSGSLNSNVSKNTLANESVGLTSELATEKRNSDLKRYIINQSFNESCMSSPIQPFMTNNLSSTLTSPLHEEMLYKPPSVLGSLNPPKVNRSRSNSNLNIVTNLISPKARDSTESTFDLKSRASSEINIPKRAPLLRRASSAILRKRSIRQNNGDSSPNSSLAINSRIASLDLDVVARSESRNKKSLFIELERNASTSSTLTDLSRGTRSNSPVVKSNNMDSSILRQPSFGSMVKKGFTRIISSGTGSSRKQQTQREPNHSIPSPTDADLISSNFGMDTNSLSDFVEEHTSSKHNLLRKRSSSLIQKRLSKTGKRCSNSNSVSSEREFSNCISSRNKSLNSNENSDLNESDTLISDAEIEEWSKKLPTITITERFGAKNTTSLQYQSNVWLYKTGFEEWKNGKNIKPSNAALKQYIDLLIEQQMTEDARFEALEKNFKDSGWVSSSDLSNLRQKRVIISAQWAERISFYQNKLEEQ